MTARSAPLLLVQCWDDGVEDDARLADLLRAHGARATFNLNPGLHEPAVRSHPWRYQDRKDVYRLPWNDVRHVYEGFPVANHTVHHPHLSRIPRAEARVEIEDGRKRLQDHFQQPVEGFVHPYGDTDAEVVALVRGAGHTHARGVPFTRRHLPAGDPLALPSLHFQDAGFEAAVEAAVANPATPFFYFWGHAYELVTEDDWSAFAARLARLTADPRLRWADVRTAAAAPAPPPGPPPGR